jgi:hypothetical protein
MADENPAAQRDLKDGNPGCYPGTDYAISYESEWSRIHGADPTLAHLNCGYLGTPGCPPTLLALKQHAQSLAILIARLNPSVRTGVVDGNAIFDNRQAEEGQVRRRLELNDAFDWLADLSRPYTNDDPNHHKPLNILSNEVKSEDELSGPEFQCPLTQVIPRDPKENRGHPYKENVSLMPFASHHLLAMHANACLELLDHEFSNEGGILGLIPEEGRGDGNSAELKAAQNSLLGQLLLYVQGLTLRNHEMDMTNAKLADALAGEAVVPLQHLSVLGPDGRSGREIAHPQDRWVLVNAGDDVWGHLHDTMDREEAALGVREDEWAREDAGAGLGGDSVWGMERARERLARGVVAVDMKSRFYRLQGQGRGTIFVLPAFASQPGTEWSERLDRYSKPTVVGTVAPRTVQRVSEYQKRWNAQQAAATHINSELSQLRAERARDKNTIEFLRAQVARNEALLRPDAGGRPGGGQDPGPGQYNPNDHIDMINQQTRGVHERAQAPPGAGRGVRFTAAKEGDVPLGWGARG